MGDRFDAFSAQQIDDDYDVWEQAIREAAYQDWLKDCQERKEAFESAIAEYLGLDYRPELVDAIIRMVNTLKETTGSNQNV